MIRVFVVEDEPLAAAAHTAAVAAMPGFTAAGTAGSVADALAAMTGPGAQPVDVVLLDLHLPDGTGLEVASRLRRAGVTAAVVAVTADRDLRAVRGALGVGAVDYLLKPFTRSVLEEKLQRVAARLHAERRAQVDQGRIDRAFASLAGEDRTPKGLQTETLELVRRALAEVPGASAGELAERTALSRPTARRYLAHLVETGDAVRSPRYGHPGRPEHEYRLR